MKLYLTNIEVSIIPSIARINDYEYNEKYKRGMYHKGLHFAWLWFCLDIKTGISTNQN